MATSPSGGSSTPYSRSSSARCWWRAPVASRPGTPSGPSTTTTPPEPTRQRGARCRKSSCSRSTIAAGSPTATRRPRRRPGTARSAATCCCAITPGWSATPRQPVALEEHLEARWDGIPIHGYIDRIDRTPDGGLEIVDYKTSRELSREDARGSDQLSIYQVLVETNYTEPVA
ncbi:hypothetical protein B1B_18798, partial [mine drainage metagenome]